VTTLILATLILTSGGPATERGSSMPELPVITPGPNVTLADVLKAADGRNLTLAAIRIEIDKARAQLEQSWALVLPVVGAQASYTHNDHADIFSLQDKLPAGLPFQVGEMVARRQDETRASLVATLPLVSPQAWAGIGAARLGVEVAELSVENARQQLLFAAAQAFWMAHVSRELVGIQESQLKAAAHHLDVAQARVEVGDAMRIDAIRAETEVEKCRQELLSAHLGLDNARDALATLMASKELPLPVAPPELVAPTPPADGDIDEALNERPDVRAAQAQVRLAARMVTVAWMQFLPTLGLSGQAGYLFSDPPELGSSDRSRWAAMLTLTVPLYNQLRYADLDAKQAARAQAALREADLRANAELEVRKASRDFRSALSSQDTAERQAALSREALALAEAAYQNGASTSLDVTDAQRSNRTAEINAVAQRLRSQMTLLNLMRVMGKGADSLL
jgi:outer membrane protein, multidrug efflux system